MSVWGYEKEGRQRDREREKERERAATAISSYCHHVQFQMCVHVWYMHVLMWVCVSSCRGQSKHQVTS